MPLRAVANALLSAGNTTDLANLQQTSISLSPTQAGAPAFPNILPAAVPSVTLVNLTTMDSEPAERVFAAGESSKSRSSSVRTTTVSVGYQLRAWRGLLMSINQNVPALRRRPAPTTAAGRSRRTPTTASTVGRFVELPRPPRVVRAASGVVGLRTVSATRCPSR
ncbi:MAG: hypothetical protein QM736_11305 [Vicinamibacterales bacterium]